MVHVFNSLVVFELMHDEKRAKQESEVIYSEWSVHDRQTDRQTDRETDKVHVEITR